MGIKLVNKLEMKLNPRIVLIIGVLAVSSASILFRFTSAPPLIVAAYRLSLASLIIGIFSYKKIGELRSLKVIEVVLLITAGFFLAIHFGSWFASLRYTTIAASTVIVDSSPVFVALLSWLFLNEKPNILGITGIILSMVGLLIIFSGHFEFKSEFFGDFLAFVGMIGLTVYLIIGRVLRKKLSTFPYVTTVYGISAIFLIFLAITNGDPLLGYSLKDYTIFILLAIIPSGIGHTSYNYALKYLKAYVVSMSVLGEPLIASLLATFLFQEYPIFSTITGGILVALGMYLVLKYEE